MKPQTPTKPPLDPIALRHQFIYNPTTGRIRPKPTPTRPDLPKPVQVRSRYWRVDHTTNAYATHRIIWALHHPEFPNPKHVTCLDWDYNNLRIENLHGSDSWPPPHNTPYPMMPQSVTNNHKTSPNT